ncbi:MAG: hypothetical protein P8R00_02165 [Candidatus Poseidoniaceae archaeon]|nr:hypothetical protein [Candidatus Poseidoniaceae archaeon]
MNISLYSQATAKPILGLRYRWNMGFLDRFKQAFGSKTEILDSNETEYRDPLEEQMREEHASRQQSVIDEAMAELEGENQKPKPEHVSDSPPDYDVGVVEAEDLLAEEETESDHSLLNIIEHESVEEMGDHLESVTILGDLPEEVEL